MTKSTHHSFDIELATEYGIVGAILIHHFQHWINHNMRCGKNRKQGRTWSYQTRKEIAAWFPYITEDQVRRETDKLVERGVLIKGNFNRSSIDKTIWWAFANEEMFTTGNFANSTGKNAKWTGESAKAIPDTETDAKRRQQQDPPDAASRVVVFSCLEELKIPRAMKEKLSDELEEDKAEQLVRRVKAWANRSSDAQACNTIMKQWDDWEDNVSSEETAEANKAWTAKYLAKYDECVLGGYKCVILRNHVEFCPSGGVSQPVIFKYTASVFQALVTEFLKNLIGKR